MYGTLWKLLCLFLVFAMLAACAPAAPAVQPAVETVVVVETVEVIVEGTPQIVEREVLVTPTSRPAPSEIVLEVWTKYAPGSNQARRDAFENARALWNEQHPETQIVHVSFASSEYRRAGTLAMFSDQAGCVVNAETGGAQLVPWVNEDKLLSLDELAAENDWLSRDAGDFIRQMNLAFPASDLHDGPQIYGVPIWFQPLGVFYNKDVFEENGLEVPTTYQEFEEILMTLQDAGYRPLAFGGATAGVSLHALSTLVAANVDMDRYLDWWNATDPNVKFTDPDFLWAAQELSEWSEAGYLSEDALALSFNDGIGKFVSGEQPMTITGDFAMTSFLEAEFPVGFFPIPPNDPNIPWASVQMGDWPMAVPVACEFPEQALEFVNFLTSPETARFIAEAGLQPVFDYDATGITPNPIQQEIAEGVEGKLSAFYIDIVDPEVASMMGPSAQLVVDGSLSPEEFAEQVQAAREKYLRESGQ